MGRLSLAKADLAGNGDATMQNLHADTPCGIYGTFNDMSRSGQ